MLGWLFLPIEVLRLLTLSVLGAFGYFFLGLRALDHLLVAMGPAFVKFGQFLSTRSDIVGQKNALHLALLCDRMRPFSFFQVERTIEQQFGKKSSILFQAFQRRPLAAASLAQVHRAVTWDNQHVIVKVLRPNVERRVRQNLQIIQAFCYGLTFFFPGFAAKLNLSLALKLFSKNLKQELNLKLEAAHMTELRKNLQVDSGAQVPKVYWNLSSMRVMTMEYFDGIPLSGLQGAAGERGGDIVRGLIQLFFNQVYRDGFFHGDLHPGNILLFQDNSIGFIDCGLMGRLSDVERLYFFQVLKGFAERDYRSVADIHFKCGYVDRRHSIADFATACCAIGESIMDRPLADISVAHLIEQLFCLAAEFDMRPIPGLLLLQKNTLLLEGMMREIAPSDLNLWVMVRHCLAEAESKKMHLKSQVILKKARLAKSFLEAERGLQSLVSVARHMQSRVDHPRDFWRVFGAQEVRILITVMLGIWLCHLFGFLS